MLWASAGNKDGKAAEGLQGWQSTTVTQWHAWMKHSVTIMSNQKTRILKKKTLQARQPTTTTHVLMNETFRHNDVKSKPWKQEKEGFKLNNLIIHGIGPKCSKMLHKTPLTPKQSKSIQRLEDIFLENRRKTCWGVTVYSAMILNY